MGYKMSEENKAIFGEPTNISYDSVEAYKSSLAASVKAAVGSDPAAANDPYQQAIWKLQRLGAADEEEFTSKLYDDYNSFLEEVKQNTEAMSFEDGKNMYRSNYMTLSDLVDRSTALNDYLSVNPNATADQKKSAQQMLSDLNTLIGNFKSTQELYSQFDSEEAFNTAKQESAWHEKYNGKSVLELEDLLSSVEDEAEKSWLKNYKNSLDYDEKKKLDIDAYDRATQMLQWRMDNYDPEMDWTNPTERKAFDATLEEMGSVIDNRRAYSQAAKLIQEKEAGREKYDAIRENVDFSKFSSYDPNNQEIGYQYINADANGRADLEQQYGQYAEEMGYNSFDSLTDEEKEVYNYLMNIGNRQGAADYLKYLQEDLNYRKAEQTFQDGYEDNKLYEYIFAAEAGLDQFRSGVQGFGNLVAGREEYVPASYKQQMSGMIREDLGDGRVKMPEFMGGATVGQAVYDTINTSANMAPSILASAAIGILNPTAGAVAGQALLGMTASGNAYQEAINNGYSKDQARGYGLLVGASEIIMEKVLGGLSGLGGNALGKSMISNLNAADGAFKMLAKRLGGSFLSEFGEEYLQEVLSPVIENITLGTHEKTKLLSADALYAGILGGLTSIVLEGGPAALETQGIKNTGRALQDKGITAERLAELGKTYSADTVAYQLAGKVNENTDAYTMGRLFNELGASLSEQNQTDITNALVAEGMDLEIARKNAEVLNYIMEGGEVSDIQMKMIQKNDILSKVMKEVLIDENSTVNQRTRGYTEAAQTMSGRSQPTETQATEAQQPAGGHKQAKVVQGVSKKETATKSSYDLSGNGKTTYIPDGKEVKIKEIASVNKGKMTLKLEDGRTVDSKDIGYADSSEALVYESVAKMDVNALAANSLVKAYHPDSGVSAEVYVRGIQESYRYGEYGYPNKMGPFSSLLTEYQRNTAYKLGKIFSGKQVAKEQAKVANRIETAKKTAKGGVFFEGSDNSVTDWDSYANKPELKPTQEAAIQTMKVLSDTLGIKFYIGDYSKRTTKGGKNINGFYDSKDGSIHIDLNAGMDSQKTMLFTLSHELTHFIRQWSPAKFKVLANFLMKEFSNHNNMDAWVHAKMKETGLKYADAYEEVVADAMEGMLADGKVMEKLAKLKRQDKTLWQKIKDFIDNWAAKLKEAYEGLKPDSAEGKAVLEMTDKLEEIQQLFAEGLVEASENYQVSQKTEAAETEPVDMAASVKISSIERNSEENVKLSEKHTIKGERKKNPYSYETLTSKPDMVVTLVSEIAPKNRADVVAQAKKNATKVGKFNPKDGSVSVHVNDIDRDVVLGTAGLKHSLDRRMDVNASITLMAGEILQNSIKINELTPQKAEADESYVLIGAAKNSNGELLVVRSVVNRFSNELTSMDVLYAINAKKENRLRSMRPGFQGPDTDSIISIADLLESVNQYFPEVLPEDVLKHFGHDARPDGKLGESALYSVRDTEAMSNRSLLMRVDESSLEHPVEVKRLREYRELVAKADAQEQILEELNGKIQNELNRKRVTQLRIEAKQTVNRLEILDKQILRKESELKTVLEREQKMAYLQGEQKRQDVYEQYRINTEVEHLKTMREYRATREELHGLQDETKVMEKEFIRIVKEYEKLSEQSQKQNGKDAKTISDLRKKLSEEAKKHKAEGEKWAKKFTELLKEYDAAGREITKLEAKIQQQRQSAKTKVDNRKKTEMRQKIRKVIRDLDKILNRGDKKRNVKEGLKDFVSEAISSAEVLFIEHYSNEDMVRSGVETELTAEEAKLLKEAQQIMNQLNSLPSGYEGWMARQEQEFKLKGKLSRRMAKLKDVFARERERLNRTTVSTVLGNLANAYGKLQNSEQEHVQGAYHEAVYEYLKMLREDIGGTVIKDMTLDQLEELYKAYTMVMTTVRNANKMFAENLNATRDALAKNVMREVRTVGGERKLWWKFGDKLNSFFWNNEKPVYAFERIGSDTLKTLYGNIRKGQDTWAVDLQEANGFRQDIWKKYNYSKWDRSKEFKFTSSSGIDFELNLEQIMSIYAYSKRAQAYDHLMRGGFVFDDGTEVKVTKYKIPLTFLKKNATAYNLSLEILEDIISKLTPEQKAFVDEMQDYLSTTMGEKGNEVSMRLYGVKMFNEQFYFPLRSAGQYMERAKEADLKKEQGQVNLVNSGFSKATKIKASNPVVLSGFMEVWASHVNEMSMYHSFVLPMEDFRRVYNYSTPHTEEQQSASVNGVIQNAYGKAATDYIDQLYRDLNGGALTDNRTGFINAAMGLFKKGAVFASWSVTIQQPSAIARATALIDTKYFVGTRVDAKKHDKNWAEVKRYAPVATIKEMGFFDTNMGRSATDFLTSQEYSGIAEKAKAFVTDGNYRDEKLSRAPALADELAWCSIWEAVKRETKDKHRNMDVRSEAFLQLAGERFSEVIDKTQVYDSVLARSANMRSKDTGMKMATAFMAEPTTSINMVMDALRKGKQGNRKQARKIIGSVVASVLLNSFLVAWVYAARDDDEDETYREKYLSAFVSGIKDGINPMTYIPFLKDIVSIVQGYDVERSDMSVISDLWNAYKQLENDDVSAWRKIEGFAGSICQIFGLPVKNIMRDVRSMYQFYDTAVNGEKNTTRGTAIAIVEGLTGQKPTDSEQLYTARKKGDDEHATRVAERYDDEDSANAAVRKEITGLYMDDKLTMAQATMQLSQYAGMKPDEAYWLMDGWKYKKEHGTDEGYSKYNAFYEAVSTGKNLKAVIQTYMDNGVKKETLSGQITSHFKDEYVAKSAADRAAMKGYLLNAYEQVGVNRKTAEEKLKEWDFEAKHGSSYEEIVKGYKAGEVTESTMRKILQERGYKKAEIDDKIFEWNIYKKYGYEYSQLDDAYRAGELSRSEFRAAMIANGTFPAKADQAIATYDWMKNHPQYDLEYSDAGKYAHPIANYGRSLSDVNLKPETYLKYKELKTECKGVDNDNDGVADSGTKRDAIFAMINSLPISNDQKDALAAIDYGMSSIKKNAPWRK